MPYTADQSPSIYYETEGAADDPTVVLIEGLSAQMVGWRQGFRSLLRTERLRLVLFDNRDVGLSGKCGEPGDEAQAYSIDDMADDVVRVLDAANVDTAHIVGQSMGGAIAQSLAVRHPTRVRSLTLFYTAPVFDASFVVQSDSPALSPSPALDRADAIAARIEGERACASPLYGFDEVWVRTAAELSYDRCPRTDGAARQRAALKASPDRRADLATLSLPCSVIHGRGDGVIRWQGGVALAEAIPGCDLHVFAGMGHVVAAQLWPQFVSIIKGMVARGDRMPAGSVGP